MDKDVSSIRISLPSPDTLEKYHQLEQVYFFGVSHKYRATSKIGHVYYFGLSYKYRVPTIRTILLFWSKL